MPLTQMQHYTVGYHDTQKHTYEICEYAMSAFEAIENCKEDVSYLKEHPHFIDYCIDTKKANAFKEVDNIAKMMASGIPMGH